MHLQVLSIEEFTNYQKDHSLSNFYETINYAMLMAEEGYDYEFLGLVNDSNYIEAATLILYKPIGFKCFYGYAPRGFLIDYTNEYILKIFTEELKNYLLTKRVVFVKVNPYVPIGEVDKKTFEVNYNHFRYLPSILNKYGYKKLLDNLYFEAKLPRFNAIIDLKEFDVKKLAKNTKNKIKKGIRKGLNFELASKSNIDSFYELMKDKDNYDKYYFQDYYTVFNKSNDVDLFLVSINYNDFLQNSQYMYDLELERNNKLNAKLGKMHGEKIINNKMNSDRILLTYKNDIMEATKGLTNGEKVYIAGALVIKHNKTATIVFSNFNHQYKRFAPNYFLHYSIIKYYQNEFDYLDLNGVVGDFQNDNPYHGLNRFKIGFNPHIYEYIGEYDLVIDEQIYDNLLRNGSLTKEFKKSQM